jgi:microcystin-dependent protein
MFGGNFAPLGWAFCSGQLVPISENETLFNLIGTTYGGDGQETFQLPDLRGRVPIHQGTVPGGSTYIIGQAAGVEQVTLTTGQMPPHNHMELAGTGNTATDPTGRVLAGGMPLFVAGNPPLVPMGTTAGPVGGNQPHDNMGPFLCVNFIISLFGIFPSQS